MEVIRRRIQFKHEGKDPIRIHPIGDIHLGAAHSAEKQIEQKLRDVAKEPNGYIVGMGDYCDCITKNDKRFDIAGLAPWVKKDNIIESQRKRVKELFSLVDPSKIICMLSGNHEETIHRFHSDDVARNICADLKVPYGGYSCFIYLDFFRSGTDTSRSVLIHAWHGNGAAQTEGARIMRLMRLVNDVEADIYLMGHLHTVAVYTPDRLTLTRSGRIKATKLAACITGAWCKTYAQPHEGEELNASYAELAGYKPARIGSPVINIWPETQDFVVEV